MAIVVGYQIEDPADILGCCSFNKPEGMRGSKQAYRTEERAVEAASEALRSQFEDIGGIAMRRPAKVRVEPDQTAEFRQAGFEIDKEPGAVFTRETWEFRVVKKTTKRVTASVEGKEYHRDEPVFEVVKDWQALMEEQDQGSWISGYRHVRGPVVVEHRLYLDKVEFEILD